jgi:hypothetical protein
MVPAMVTPAARTSSTISSSCLSVTAAQTGLAEGDRGVCRLRVHGQIILTVPPTLYWDTVTRSSCPGR